MEKIHIAVHVLSMTIDIIISSFVFYFVFYVVYDHIRLWWVMRKFKNILKKCQKEQKTKENELDEMD